ncbi:MAG: hypothetical protein IT449_16690 [Phycisphaerales bacterium]|nr:hypothetical protein [Phycisphaerales bacterium]
MQPLLCRRGSERLVRVHGLLRASLGILALIASGGCTRKDASHGGNDNVAERAVERVARGGPIELRLRADDESPAFGSTLRARVEVLADADAVVRLDDYALAMERQPFGYGVALRATEDAAPQPDGRKRWRREYELTFFVPGEHTLPPATLTWVQPVAAPAVQVSTAPQPPAATSSPPSAPPAQPPHGQPAEQRLSTDSITLNVRPTDDLNVPADQLAQLASPAPVELPEDRIARRWRAWLIGAAALLVVATAGVLWWRRRQRRASQPSPPIPADVWATRALDALLAEQLVERGQVHEFYFRVSAIVRGFIERRFGLHAAEMTTGEFLQEALTGEMLGESNRSLLGEFLEACDLVKFARFEPQPRAITQTVESARAFIQIMGPTQGTNHQPAVVAQLAAQEVGA